MSTMEWVRWLMERRRIYRRRGMRMGTSWLQMVIYTSPLHPTAWAARRTLELIELIPTDELQPVLDRMEGLARERQSNSLTAAQRAILWLSGLPHDVAEELAARISHRLTWQPGDIAEAAFIMRHATPDEWHENWGPGGRYAIRRAALAVLAIAGLLGTLLALLAAVLARRGGVRR